MEGRLPHRVPAPPYQDADPQVRIFCAFCAYCTRRAPSNESRQRIQLFNLISDNRIAPVTTGDSELIGIARDCGDPHLQELSVNNCLLSSHEVSKERRTPPPCPFYHIERLTPLPPSYHAVQLWTLTSVLRVSRLEAANNRLTSLGIQPGSSVFQNLESLNLTSNLIVDWPDFARTIWTFDAYVFYCMHSVTPIVSPLRGTA